MGQYSRRLTTIPLKPLGRSDPLIDVEERDQVLVEPNLNDWQTFYCFYLILCLHNFFLALIIHI